MKALWKSSLLFIVTAFVLSACSSQGDGGDGILHNLFVEPFTQAIELAASVTGGNYGMAIIVITVMIRLVLMPLMLNMYKNQQQMKVKMAGLKPEMDDIQARMKEATPEDKQKIQQEMMGLYQKHGVNPLNMGCLPMLLQMPILMGFYFAIRSSETIATHSFLWFNLGEPNIAMALIAGALYFIQYRISLIGVPASQQKQMKLIGLLSPVMIFIISLNAPAALPVYWAVGGLFLIVQTIIGRKLYQTEAETAPQPSN